jgi:hypothetical protein
MKDFLQCVWVGERQTRDCIDGRYVSQPSSFARRTCSFPCRVADGANDVEEAEQHFPAASRFLNLELRKQEKARQTGEEYVSLCAWWGDRKRTLCRQAGSAVVLLKGDASVFAVACVCCAVHMFW